MQMHTLCDTGCFCKWVASDEQEGRGQAMQIAAEGGSIFLSGVLRSGVARSPRAERAEALGTRADDRSGRVRRCTREAGCVAILQAGPRRVLDG